MNEAIIFMVAFTLLIVASGMLFVVILAGGIAYTWAQEHQVRTVSSQQSGVYRPTLDRDGNSVLGPAQPDGEILAEDEEALHQWMYMKT